MSWFPWYVPRVRWFSHSAALLSDTCRSLMPLLRHSFSSSANFSVTRRVQWSMNLDSWGVSLWQTSFPQLHSYLSGFCLFPSYMFSRLNSWKVSIKRWNKIILRFELLWWFICSVIFLIHSWYLDVTSYPWLCVDCCLNKNIFESH